MIHAALLASLLTAAVSPIPSPDEPAPPAAVTEPVEEEPPLLPPPPAPVATDHSPWPQIGLGALQLAVGCLAGYGGTLGLLEAGIYPRGFGGSEGAGVLYMGLLAPTLASTAVWGAGHLTSRYRGHWWKTLLGAYLGAAAGVVIGAMLEPVIASALGVGVNPDVDTRAVSVAIGALVFMPVGAVAGWHLSKQEIAQPAPLAAPPVMLTAQPARNLMLPVISLRW